MFKLWDEGIKCGPPPIAISRVVEYPSNCFYSLFGIKKDTINGCNFFRLINVSDFFVVSFSTSVT